MARIVKVFGATYPHHAYLFAISREFNLPGRSAKAWYLCGTERDSALTL